MMLTEAERQKVLDHYHSGWATGKLKQAVSNVPERFDGPYSVQEFLHQVWASPRHSASLMAVTPETTLGDYFRQGVRTDGHVVPFRDIAYPALCVWPLDWVLWEALAPRGATQAELGRARELLKQGAVAALAPEVWDSILIRYGATPLIDLFRANRSDEGWYEWFPASFSPNRNGDWEGVREWTLPTQFGSVTLKVLRNPWCEQVNAYEWEATLIGHADEVWCRCVGSMYVLKPRTGLSGPDFFLSAETMCEHDAAMVFDLPWWESGLSTSVAFSWIWERHESAPKGCGVACLSVVLQQLKRSYKSLTALVLDARPRQWTYFGCESEPEVLRQLRATDCQRLLDGLDLGRLADALGPNTDLSVVYPSLDDHPLGVETLLPEMAAASFGIFS